MLAYPNAHLVVVGDDRITSQRLPSLLAGAGYQNIAYFSDAASALVTLAKTLPDLIVLDLDVLGASGVELMKQLQQQWLEAMPPVVVLIDQSTPSYRQEALLYGALAVLSQPVDERELCQRVHNILQHHYRGKQERERSYELQTLVEARTAELKTRSLQDPVTGLPNRRAILHHLSRRLVAQAPLGIFFMRVRQLNDIARLHGYAVSDALMCGLADQLESSAVAQGGFLGAWSSEDFLLIKPLPLEQWQSCGERLVRLMNGPMPVGDLMLDVLVDIGISHSSDEHDSAETLIRHAVMALPLGRDMPRLLRYRSSMTAQFLYRNRLRLALKDAPQQGQLALYFQPKIELGTGLIVGAEALLRWTHPEMGSVSPSDFIPVAEQTDAINVLGHWVVEAAITYLAQWLETKALADEFVLAINVSGQQLMQTDFSDQLLESLQLAQVPAHHLQVEVTESALMGDVELARDQLIRLNHNGVTSAIDDFGTGYSSLAYLKHLPVSVLKIDRSFIMEIEHNPQDQRLAQTVVNMAHNFGCQVVAEGIENDAQAQLLAAMGCELGQGFYYARPMPADEFMAFCQRWVHQPAASKPA